MKSLVSVLLERVLGNVQLYNVLEFEMWRTAEITKHTSAYQPPTQPYRGFIARKQLSFRMLPLRVSGGFEHKCG